MRAVFGGAMASISGRHRGLRIDGTRGRGALPTSVACAETLRTPVATPAGRSAPAARPAHHAVPGPRRGDRPFAATARRTCTPSAQGRCPRRARARRGQGPRGTPGTAARCGCRSPGASRTRTGCACSILRTPKSCPQLAARWRRACQTPSDDRLVTAFSIAPSKHSRSCRQLVPTLRRRRPRAADFVDSHFIYNEYALHKKVYVRAT